MLFNALITRFFWPHLADLVDGIQRQEVLSHNHCLSNSDQFPHRQTVRVDKDTATATTVTSTSTTIAVSHLDALRVAAAATAGRLDATPIHQSTTTTITISTTSHHQPLPPIRPTHSRPMCTYACCVPYTTLNATSTACAIYL